MSSERDTPASTCAKHGDQFMSCGADSKPFCAACIGVRSSSSLEGRTEPIDTVRSIVKEWNEKQGHDRCWYYPDLFDRLSDALGIGTPPRHLPSREEFAEGCRKFQVEEFGPVSSGEPTRDSRSASPELRNEMDLMSGAASTSFQTFEANLAPPSDPTESDRTVIDAHHLNDEDGS